MGLHYGPNWIKTQTLRYEPPTTPRLLIQVESSGYETTPNYARVRVVARAVELVNATAPRSYRLTQLRQVNGAWTLIASNGYDVYGDTVAAASAATFLNGFSNGDLLISNTQDEPASNSGYITPIFRDSFGSNIYNYTRESRDMHLLVAIKGRGIIYEEWRPRYSAAITFTGWLQ